MLTRVRDRSGEVRVRTTAVAVIVVGVALVFSAVAMIVLLRRSLTSDVRSAALLRAESAAEGFSVDDHGAIPVGDKEEEFVQVLGVGGQVVASSANLAGHGAIVRLTPGETREVERLPFEDDAFLAVAVSAPSSRPPVTVVAGRSLETVTESSQAVVSLLATGIPLLLALLGVVMWRVVSRALAPVESMRAEVEAISTGELHRRVPDPPGKDEVARLADTMNRMLARLQAGHARQRRFVSDASHELRSPIATIRQHAEVARVHPSGTSIDELAEVVLEENLRLEQLVEDLLLLAQLDEGTATPRREPVDLDDLLFEAAERLRGSKDLRVDSRGVSAGRVVGDREQLLRLVRNLSDNAARHANGVVNLALREAEGEVVLTVDDDGDGIPLRDRTRVFERFIRLDEARDRDSGGSGLGLAIVAEVAAAHGAKVTVLESPLGGARLEVRFPLLEAEPIRHRSFC